MTSLNRQLREALVPGAGLLVPGAGNALTARIIEDSGHHLFLLSGAAIANNFLGVPDIGLVSLGELASHVSAVRDAVSIPMIVDADTGFGNAVNVGHTVRVIERAGANAIMLEDQVFPKRCGHFENKHVIPCEEMVQKIRAAVDARRDPDLMILGRTDARAVEGIRGAIDRANAYREAGADFLFIEAPLSIEEIELIPREVPGLHVCNMVVGGKTPLLPQERIRELGYAVILYANAALQAAMLAMREAMVHLHRHGSMQGHESRLIDFKERQKVVRGDYFDEVGRRFGTTK